MHIIKIIILLAVLQALAGGITALLGPLFENLIPEGMDRGIYVALAIICLVDLVVIYAGITALSSYPISDLASQRAPTPVQSVFKSTQLPIAWLTVEQVTEPAATPDSASAGEPSIARFITPWSLQLPTPPPVPIPSPRGPPVIITTTDLNVRTGPGPNYPIVGWLTAGTEAMVTGQNHDGTWWQIIYPPGSNEFAWIYAYYTRLPSAVVPEIDIPIAPWLSPTPTAIASPVISATSTPSATVSFWADTYVVKLGQCITLYWLVEHVRVIHLNGEGVTGPEGRQGRVVCPINNPTVYTLEVTYLDGIKNPYPVIIHVLYPTPLPPTPSLPTPTPSPSPSPPPTPTPQSPIADPNGPYEGNEGEEVAFDGTGSSEPEGEGLDYSWNFGDGNTSAGATPSHTYVDNGIYDVCLTVTDPGGLADTQCTTATVNNVLPVVSADPVTQEVQYSDPIADVTFTATDIAADPMFASTSWSVDGGGFTAGLPSDLALTDGGCSVSDSTNTCIWTLSGVTTVPSGTYTVRVMVEDDDGGPMPADITLAVLPEDATVTFNDENPIAVQAAEPDGTSDPFSLTVYVSEAQPDQPVDSSAPGDISLADVSMSLAPVGPGGPVDGACTPGAVTGSGYDGVLPVTCSFDGVEVNAYTAQVTVGGGYYTGGTEDVLTIYDPSLHFTTGGGWFYWPGTNERTNFGFTMKYNKKGEKVKGNLLLLRHLPDGSIYRVKSNALYGLALGESPDPTFGWASFSGKSTYLEPGWPEPEGNYEFLVYVEDRDEPGTGVDRFWIEVKDRIRGVVPALSMAREATDNAIQLQGGNIAVPHRGGGGGSE